MAIEFQKTFESNNRAMTKEEKEFSEIWKEVLKCQDVSLKDDFFSSGGNSLKAITLANRIKREIYNRNHDKRCFGVSNSRTIIRVCTEKK